MKKNNRKRRRASGEGTILKRNDGRWAAVLDAGWAGGRRNRIWLYGAPQAEVRDKFTEARQKQQRGLPMVPEKQSLKQSLERWLGDVLSPRMVKHLRDVRRNALHVAVEWHLIEATRPPEPSLRRSNTLRFPSSRRHRLAPFWR